MAQGFSRCQFQLPSAATGAAPWYLPSSQMLTRTALGGAVPAKETAFPGTRPPSAGIRTVGRGNESPLTWEVSLRYASIPDVSRSGSSYP